MKDKKIILAITGSIAAYKAATLTRLLIKKGAEVQVLMTPSAAAFISPLTLSTLSKNKVHLNVIDEDSWDNHVELGLWADAMVVAPATANSLAKMATGICDTIVNAVYLSAKCPVFFAPAMDRDMWIHPSTQNNIALLKSYGNHLIDVEDGELASGLIGKGRMAEPESIVEKLDFFFQAKQDLLGKTVLITAGPTYESLDPVRFIGNLSSGKMGMAIAEECAHRGAQVKLVLGPSKMDSHHQNIEISRVRSGDEMFNQTQSWHSQSDVVIFTAAVADYKPAIKSDKKIKKKGETLNLELVKTIDIAKTLGQKKSKKQIHIGFALETNKEEEYAQKKLEKKNFDFIVLNSLRDEGAGFQHDTNKITIYTDKSQKIPFELKTKREVAVDIINTLVNNYVNKED